MSQEVGPGTGGTGARSHGGHGGHGGGGRGDGDALRGLVGAGPSKVGVSGAMRARDVSRPVEAESGAVPSRLDQAQRDTGPSEPAQLDATAPPGQPPGSGGSSPEDS